MIYNFLCTQFCFDINLIEQKTLFSLIKNNLTKKNKFNKYIRCFSTVNSSLSGNLLIRFVDIIRTQAQEKHAYKQTKLEFYTCMYTQHE